MKLIAYKQISNRTNNMIWVSQRSARSCITCPAAAVRLAPVADWRQTIGCGQRTVIAKSAVSSAERSAEGDRFSRRGRAQSRQVAVDRGQAADEGGEIIDRCAVDRLADLKQAIVLDKLIELCDANGRTEAIEVRRCKKYMS